MCDDIRTACQTSGPNVTRLNEIAKSDMTGSALRGKSVVVAVITPRMKNEKVMTHAKSAMKSCGENES